MPNLCVKGNEFYLEESPFQIVSAAMHYFRVPRMYWKDRLRKIKGCGFNTVETYVPWNLHEPREGQFDFRGEKDLCFFLECACEEGLHVLLRPGPYICSEWECGGLPFWLCSNRDLHVRCSDPAYLEKVDRYFGHLLPLVIPYQSTHGGPILAMQVENEYGSYGNDKVYLAHLRDKMRELGVDVLLFTSDGGMDSMLSGGTIDGVLKTVNFGSRTAENFAALRRHQPVGPLMCSEFWDGWFDHWGEARHERNAEDAAAVLEEILSMGGSASVYMFVGGTNFGFMNGCNYFSRLEPTQTSYDFDAPVSEDGSLTEKYFAMRRVVEKYFGQLPPVTFSPIPKKDYGIVQMRESAPLFENLDCLSDAQYCAYPETMEHLGQNYGFILYRTEIQGPVEKQPLLLREVHDRGLVFCQGEYQATVMRDEPQPEIYVGAKAGETVQLDILVENMGRINYGPYLADEKGIIGGVALNIDSMYPQNLFGWQVYCLPLDNLSGLRYQAARAPEGQPVFLRGSFYAEETADTFADMANFTKGVLFINGKNVGRYWNAGPQKRLYIPASFLKAGENSLEVLELHGMQAPEVHLCDAHDRG